MSFVRIHFTRFAVILFGRKHNQYKYLPGRVNKTSVRSHFLYVLLINFRKRCGCSRVSSGYEYTCTTQFSGDEWCAVTKMTALLVPQVTRSNAVLSLSVKLCDKGCVCVCVCIRPLSANIPEQDQKIT